MGRKYVNYKGHDLNITYHLQPEEDETGSKAQVDIEEIFLGKEDVTELLEPQIDDVEKALIEYLKEVDDEVCN